MKLIFSILAVFLFQTCQSDTSLEYEMVIWVHSAKIECTGVSEMSCLQIQKGKTLNLSKDWELFYSEIEGFDYQPGFLYKLKIKTETVENPPADGSSIKYILLDILEKKKDARYAIHDIYILTHINGKSIENDPVEQRPTLEINISKMKIVGSNGCNNFGGSITKLEDNNIEFSQLMETLKMCSDMTIPTSYSHELTNTRSFKKDNSILYFHNSENKNILTFKKVD